MFLTCVIAETKNPKNKTDVYLQHLIEKLKELWDVGIEMYDISMDKTFQMKAILMWTSMISRHMECYLGEVLMVNWHVQYVGNNKRL